MIRITKKMKESVDARQTKIWSVIKQNYGSALPSNDKLQMKDGVFLCNKCGTVGKYDDSFTGCPTCKNTNYESLDRFGSFSINDKKEAYSVHMAELGIRAVYFAYSDMSYRVNTNQSIPDIKIKFLVYIVEQNGEIGIYDYSFKRMKEKRIPLSYTDFAEISSASLVELEYGDEDFFTIKETPLKNAIEASLKSSIFNENNLLNVDITSWIGDDYTKDAKLTIVGKTHESHYPNKFGGKSFVFVCGKCGAETTLNTTNEFFTCHKCEKCGAENVNRYNGYHQNSFKTYVASNESCLQMLFIKGCLVLESGITKDLQELYLCQVDSKGETKWYQYLGKVFATGEAPTVETYSQIELSPEQFETISNFKGLKYTGWNEFFKSLKVEFANYMLPRYFDLLSRDRRIELLAKAGFTNTILNMFHNGIPKEFEKIQKAPKGLINLLKQANVRTPLSSLFDCYKRDPNVCWEDFDYLVSRYRNVQDILRLKIPGIDVSSIAKYIRYVDEQQACPPEESVQLWSDYLRMLKRLEVDFGDRRALFPNSLKREHDKASRKVSILRDEVECEKFNKKVSSEKYKALEYSGRDYSVIIPKSPEDLFEEGRKLNHCVGTYVGTVASGYSKIVFVRQKGELEKPLATMEIRGNEIIQIKGFSNARPSNKVMDFVKNEYAAKQHLLLAV